MLACSAERFLPGEKIARCGLCFEDPNPEAEEQEPMCPGRGGGLGVRLLGGKLIGHALNAVAHTSLSTHSSSESSSWGRSIGMLGMPQSE